MNAAAFALVLLAAGYIVLRNTPFTRPWVFRTDGHALYFTVVASSLAVAAFTAILLHELERIPVLGEMVSSSSMRMLTLFDADAKARSLGKVAIAAVPVALLLAFALGLPVRSCPSLREQLLLAQNSVSELEEFLWAAASRGLPVMLTLGSGKVYVGTGIRTAVLRDDRRWLRLEPILSGYRDQTQTFQLTTSYAWLHGEHGDDEPPLEDFDILMPFDDIRSVHAFDLPTYLNRFSQESSASTDNTPRPSPTRSRLESKAVRLYYGYALLICLIPLGSFLWGMWAALVMGIVALIFGFGAAVDEQL